MRTLKIITTAYILLFICSTNAQTISTTLDAAVRDVSDLNIGFNRRSDQGTWWTDTSFMDRLSEMNPDVVRYPAGTQANYWDWSTGQFIPNTDKTWGNKEVVTIPTFVNALPDRTKIVYVVNMARPTPATGVDVNANEAILKSDTTLNLKIADMLSAIAEFVAKGKMPYAVEFGNEFYFGNIESGMYQIIEDEVNGVFYSGWDEANNQPYQSATKQDATEITALLYLMHCKAIATAIKAQYPSIKFALTTTKSGNGNSSRDRWNNTIFDNLQNNPEFNGLKQDIHAVTQHHYLNDNYGVQNTIIDNASAKVAIAEGIQYPIDKQSDYDLVPSDFKIWYTEYGEVKGIAEETWASGLRYAALVYSWLNRGDQVEQLDYHYISDNNVIQVGSPMRLAPIGIAAKLVAKASAEMTEMQSISFNNNPISVNGIPSLFGYKFKNATKETLLVININDTSFTDVQIGNLFSYSGIQTLIQYRSDSPYITGVAEGDTTIISINSDITGTFNASRFSISVIEVANTLTIEDDFLNDITMYPNPVEDQLVFKSENSISAISIYSTNGTEVYKTNTIKNNSVSINTLLPGIYVVKIKTDKGFTHKKLIKE